MTTNNERKSNTVAVLLNPRLALKCDQLMAAKAAGLRFNGKPVSYPVCLEIGIDIVLGKNETDEEILEKKLAEVRSEELRKRLEGDSIQLQLDEIRKGKVIACADKERKQLTIEAMAAKLEEMWFDVTENKARRMRIEFICSLAPEYDLDPIKVWDLIPKKYKPVPTKDEYLELATRILTEGVENAN